MLATCVLIVPLSINSRNNQGNQLKNLTDAIADEGYIVELAVQSDIHSEQLASNDMILLEIAQPADIEFCREIRISSLTPVLLFGDDVNTSLWIEGVQVGADGYVDLSTDPQVILARMRAIIRRYELA